MEESVKISGRKKLPAIPSNFVTLHQLQERWVKEQERKKREEIGEIDEAQRGQEETEKPVEEKVDAGRGGRQNGHYRRRDWKSEKPKDDEGIDAGFAVEKTQRGQEENENPVEGRVHAGRDSRKDGHFRRRRDWKSEKPKEAGIEAGLAVEEIEGVEKEKKGEELKKKKKKKKKKWKSKKHEKAGVANDGEEVVATAANAPLPPRVENDKREDEEEKVVEDKPNAPELAIGKARRGWKPKTMTRADDRTVEIGQGVRAMSMNGDVTTKDHRRYGGRQYGYSNHRGGMFDRRSEVWVKKGEVSDGNVGGNQTSSSSSKGQDID